MRKKFLSLALTLAMCLGLTVPAFAVTIDVTYSVDPIGIATIQGEDLGFGDVYVFDQDVLVTPSDGRSFEFLFMCDVNGTLGGSYGGNLAMYGGGGISQVKKEDVCLFRFSIDSVNGKESAPYIASKTYIDQLIAEGTVVDFRPYTATQPTTPTVGGFTDVKTGDYFADPVLWAVEKKITAGTSKTTFSPNENCSVAQILTFLWRANGSPKPTGSNPFTDVKSGDYYADAAVWAYEKGMVSGSTFGGNTPCTRSMAVTYMWKAAGSPAASYDGKFGDVPANADYAQAVAWALANGVTSGTSETAFSPASTCTRGQIVTFLYRGLAK